MINVFYKCRTPTPQEESTCSTPVPPKPWRSKKRKMDADAFEMEILRQLKETAPSTTSTEIENTNEDFAFGKTIALTLAMIGRWKI